MEKFFLEDPIYSEPEQSVRLVLKNNIVMRKLRRKDRALEYVGENVWSKLSSVDRDIIAYMASNKEVSRSELAHYLKKSDATISNHVKTLINQGLVKANGSVHDPGRTYSIVCEEE
jgi:ATP-dependent DNA helicase RecG